MAASQSKNAISAKIKHSRYFLKRQISGHSSTVEKVICIMLGMLDTAFGYVRALIVCKFLQESFKVKESSLPEI